MDWVIALGLARLAGDCSLSSSFSYLSFRGMNDAVSSAPADIIDGNGAPDSLSWPWIFSAIRGKTSNLITFYSPLVIILSNG